MGKSLKGTIRIKYNTCLYGVRVMPIAYIKEYVITFAALVRTTPRAKGVRSLKIGARANIRAE